MELEIESLHLLVLLCTAVVIFIADHDGYRYFRGEEHVLKAQRVMLLHRAVWIGLTLMIITGALLLFDELDVLEEPAFYVKMIMVAALVTNGFFIGTLTKYAHTIPFSELSKEIKIKLLLSGLISGICWVGAASIGLFFL